MEDTSPNRELQGVQPRVLVHAGEFVELMYRLAPAEYRRLLAKPRFAALLGEAGRFNHGKLCAYAEFRVFRREFLERFPGASAQACINAFSKLLLKNDVSISNLVNFLEAGGEEREQLRLNSPP
ncbi:MAG: hypothetical protein RQ826_10330 [Xanthomonadales bacterium]|nr:hypothetical protein [Xanthomonadales bacterium]